MTKVEDSLKSILHSIEKCKNGDVDATTMMNFLQNDNGHTLMFNADAVIAIDQICENYMINSAHPFNAICKEDLSQCIRKVLVNIDEEGYSSATEIGSVKSRFFEELKSLVCSKLKDYIHYFPAISTLFPFYSSETYFDIGPVRIYSRSEWAKSIELPNAVVDNFLNLREENINWKQDLYGLIDKSTNIAGALASLLYSSIDDCSCLVSVHTKEREYNISKKNAEIIAKSALDSLSLIMGSRSSFHQNTLRNQALQPIKMSSLAESDGYLLLPGSELSQSVNGLSPVEAKAHISKNNVLFKAVGLALEDVVALNESKHSPLYQRWFTALDWYAEGCRENNDAISIGKMASAMDTLANGGKYIGILTMTVNILSISDDSAEIWPLGTKKISTQKAIKSIYNEGRSRIFHGNHIDRMKRYDFLRKLTEYVTLLLLRKSLPLISSLDGEPDDNIFRSINKA